MTTRSSKKTLPPTDSPMNKRRKEESWMMISKESLLLQNNAFTIITLPHPGHGNPVMFCLDDYNKKMHEIITFNEAYRSWFVNNSVKSDGSLIIATPFNPIYLVLPRLKEQCCSRAVPLEDLLSEKGYDKIVNFIDNLNDVADLKGPAELKAYKYNEDKTIAWLETRIHRLARALKNKNIHVTSGAKSSTFVSSNLCNDDVDYEFFLKYAHGIISEYLQDDLVALLEKKFNFKEELIEVIGKKRKSEATDILGDSKRVKSEVLDDITPTSNSSTFTEVKVKKTTAKEKARQKAASGTKTISSFFTKK
ncbi:unnamed protein product [Leptidea sinapis]|uniref:Ribonuclease H2 subunit B n=1 Tax=Leptidea sinapis TaxID=189913 RepID=A0A5E4Q762_9NEOP|nr:unnamed protein product [Leptidea sinapis]